MFTSATLIIDIIYCCYLYNKRHSNFVTLERLVYPTLM